MSVLDNIDDLFDKDLVERYELIQERVTCMIDEKIVSGG